MILFAGFFFFFWGGWGITSLDCGLEIRVGGRWLSWGAQDCQEHMKAPSLVCLIQQGALDALVALFKKTLIYVFFLTPKHLVLGYGQLTMS